jgi:hypothetical protein
MSGGIQKDAARLLGISSRVINYKIKKYKLQQLGKTNEPANKTEVCT